MAIFIEHDDEAFFVWLPVFSTAKICAEYNDRPLGKHPIFEPVFLDPKNRWRT